MHNMVFSLRRPYAIIILVIKPGYQPSIVRDFTDHFSRARTHIKRKRIVRENADAFIVVHESMHSE